MIGLIRLVLVRPSSKLQWSVVEDNAAYGRLPFILTTTTIYPISDELNLIVDGLPDPISILKKCQLHALDPLS